MLLTILPLRIFLLLFLYAFLPASGLLCAQDTSDRYTDDYKVSARSSVTEAGLSTSLSVILPDTIHLEEIRVEATRLILEDRLHAVRVYRIDRSLMNRFRGSSLSSVIENNFPLNVRDYGPGGISSISVRGFGPGQTQVLWEGIPVNHPMVGQTDLALYPASAFSTIEFVPGNSAAAYGSGSIAGTVHLGSGSEEREATVTRTVGDFGMTRASIEVTEAAGPVTVSLGASGYKSENNYGYFDRIRQREAERANADKQAFSLTGRVGYRSGRWKAGTVLWTGYNRGGVPGSVITGQTAARQDDNWIRWAGNAEFRHGTTRYYSHAYYSRHNLDYVDERTRTDSRSSSHSSGLTTGFTGYISQSITINGLLQGGRQWIDTNNYNRVRGRTFGAAALTGVVELPAGFRLFPGLRTDLYSDFGLALSPSLGINLELFDRIVILRAQYSNDFSAPTMNDLFWSPGGNPALRPERGIGVEAGASVVWKHRSLFRIAIDGTIYRTAFRDGIRWAPAGGSIWSPANVGGLAAGGIELNQEFSLWAGSFKLDVYNRWMKTGISSGTARFEGDPAVGLQLPYVPKRTFKTGLSVTHRFFTLFASRIYTGERYTTADHSSPLDPLDDYTVINAGITVTAGWRNFYAATTLTVRNLFDEEYEMIAWYPLPLSNRELSITIGYRPGN
ncbi:MAG: TonB-dependent receptor plug domain-containing protein [Cyclonatronaceae bacterium]